jgi:hypothetical protein
MAGVGGLHRICNRERDHESCFHSTRPYDTGLHLAIHYGVDFYIRRLDR